MSAFGKKNSNFVLNKKSQYLAISIFLSVLLSGCLENTQDDLEPKKTPVSRGVILATLSRYIDTLSLEPFEQFNFSGMFLEFNREENDSVKQLLGLDEYEINLPLDTCQLPSPVLAMRKSSEDPLRNTAIELLDVGNLSIKYNKVKHNVSTRTFPDLLNIIVGVMYTTDESRNLIFMPNENYTVKSTGSDKVSAFDVSLEAPDDLENISVNGMTIDQAIPSFERGEKMTVTWDGDGYGDEVIISFDWVNMGTPWSMICRARDDGQFVIPSGITALLTDPLTISNGEMVISRIRQVAFRSEGLSWGTFRFILRVTTKVEFLD